MCLVRAVGGSRRLPARFFVLFICLDSFVFVWTRYQPFQVELLPVPAASGARRSILTDWAAEAYGPIRSAASLRTVSPKRSRNAY